MRQINNIACLAILIATAALLTMAPPALAEAGYQVVFNDYAYSGSPVQAGGSTVTATVSNNSSAVLIKVSQIGYDDRSGTIEPGSTMVLDNLRIAVANNGVDHTGIGRVFLTIEKWQSGTPASSGPSLTCTILGQQALGGDRVTFAINIQNNDNEGHTYTLTASSDTGWGLSFASGGKNLYKLYVPGRQSATVDLAVQTSASAGMGEKRVTARVDNSAIDVYVYITSVNQSADVTYDVSSKIASVGDKITYNLKIKNLQSKENIYRLSASGLPANWFYRYKSDAMSTEELSEVVIPAGGERSLVLEIVPPYSVSPGDFTFVSTVTTPDGSVMNKDLMLRLKSSVGMDMVTSKLQYDAKPGEPLNIDVYVRNTGTGTALTNVYLETDAPDGWTVQVTPNRTNSITAGNTGTFHLKVTPPGNIVASDYEVTVKAKSDQAEKEKSFRITVKVDSIIPYIGGGIILVVVVGLFLVYRKYGRR